MLDDVVNQTWRQPSVSSAILPQLPISVYQYLALWRCLLCLPTRTFCGLEQFIETYPRLANNQIMFGRSTRMGKFM